MVKTYAKIFKPSWKKYFFSYTFGWLFFLLPPLFATIARSSDLYIITDYAIIVQKGLFLKVINKIKLIDINSITMSQSLFQRFLNIGTIFFSTAEISGTEIVFSCIDKPKKIITLVKRLKSNLII